MELQTLVEEDETIDHHAPLEHETQYSSSLDHPTQWEDHMTTTNLDDQALLTTHNDEEALNRNSLRDSFMSDSSTTNRTSFFNVSVFTVCLSVCLSVYLSV